MTKSEGHITAATMMWPKSDVNPPKPTQRMQSANGIHISISLGGNQLTLSGVPPWLHTM